MVVQVWEHYPMDAVRADLVRARLEPDLTLPEAGRILRDYAFEDVDIAVQKITALYPHWYAAFAEGTLGWEHNLAHPIDSFQVFNAQIKFDFYLGGQGKFVAGPHKSSPGTDIGRYRIDHRGVVRAMSV